MDRLKRLSLLTFALMNLVCATLHAQYVDVVNDTKTISTVMRNTATMDASWQAQKSVYNKIRNLQEKNAGYAVDMAVIAEAYKISMENINGFGTESKYYQYIGEAALDIATRMPNLISTVSRASIPGKAYVLTELSNLYGKTYQLVSDFINIATNAKVKSPLGNTGNHGSEAKKGDGYNLLDRNDRLSIAVTIYADLQSIRYKVFYLEWMAKYASWNSLFYKMDPQSWIKIISAKVTVQHLVNKWNQL